MARIRLIMLAVLAVFVVGAVASASASAAVKGEFVNKEGKTLIKNVFTATSGESKLETTGGTKVTCVTSIVLGNITSTTGGEATVHFKTCTSSTLPCKSINPTGAVAGEIIVLVGLLVLALNATEDTVHSTILKPGSSPAAAGEIEFECSGLKIRVKGGFFSNGIIASPTQGQKTLWPVVASQTKGVQSVLKDLAGKEDHLETSIEGKGFEQSGQQGTATFHFLESGEFV